MARVLRLAFRVIGYGIAALLFETGLVGIPSALTDQAKWLGHHGGSWGIRLAALVLAALVALVALGPDRLQSWRGYVHEMRTNRSPEAPSAAVPPKRRPGYLGRRIVEERQKARARAETGATPNWTEEQLAAKMAQQERERAERVPRVPPQTGSGDLLRDLMRLRDEGRKLRARLGTSGGPFAPTDRGFLIKPAERVVDEWEMRVVDRLEESQHGDLLHRFEAPVGRSLLDQFTGAWQTNRYAAVRRRVDAKVRRLTEMIRELRS